MINKRISKITLLSAMFVAGVVNAQEFYTCVPKKSWWGDVIKSNVPSASDIANALPKTNPAPNNPLSWQTIISLKPSSYQDEFKQTLYPGKYRVSAAAAGGARVIEEFTLTVPTEFKACVGESGGDAKGKTGGQGGGVMGYNGLYGGYGKGSPGSGGSSSMIVPDRGIGGSGCYRGGDGGNYTYRDTGYGAGGGGGGSYFQILDIELVLKGGDGEKGGYLGGSGAKPGGYVKIEMLK